MSALPLAGRRQPRSAARTRSWVLLSHTSWAVSLTLLALLAMASRTGPVDPPRPFVATDIRIVNDSHILLGVRPAAGQPSTNADAVRLAASPERFALFSKDDPAYRSAVHPRDVRFPEQTEERNTQGEKWIALDLPYPLKRGRTYEVYAADVKARFPLMLTFDEWRLRSGAIRVPPEGFRVAAIPKRVHIEAPDERDVARLRRSLAHVVRTDTRKEEFAVPVLGEPAATAGLDVDISRLKRPGEYVVVVEGVGSSAPFRVW